MKKKDNKDNRRKFLKSSLTFGAALATGSGAAFARPDETGANPDKKTEKVKVLTTEGKVIEIERPVDECKIDPCAPPIGDAARHGIPGRSFSLQHHE